MRVKFAMIVIMAVIVFTGAVRSFLGPVYNTLFARALPRDQFTRGASIGAVVFQAALVLGPAIGGVLIGVAGKGTAYALSDASGSIDLILWDSIIPAEVRAALAEGMKVSATGEIGEYSGKLQLKANPGASVQAIP